MYFDKIKNNQILVKPNFKFGKNTILGVPKSIALITLGVPKSIALITHRTQKKFGITKLTTLTI
jgi:hypothetical protein